MAYWSTKMEQFTRECLEIDKDNGDNSGQNLALATPMDQIYQRAAKLIKRTLDVEGSVVMDVSHVQVLENVNSESTAAVVYMMQIQTLERPPGC
jgi:hypothetical protein